MVGSEDFKFLSFKIKVNTTPGKQIKARLISNDGSGTILRFWEQAGISEKRTVKFPEGFKAIAVQPIDLRGNTIGEKIVVRNGAFDFYLNKKSADYVVHDLWGSFFGRTDQESGR